LFARLLQWQPDVFIGIDAPDFNLGLERRLKARGLRTVHYVSPSVWAWRPGRAAKLGRSADRVLCLFPMEPPIYRRHGVDARFVGHPLADQMPMDPDQAAARGALGLDAQVPVLAVLPGSRLGEIGRLAEPFLRAAMALAATVPGLRVVVPAANAGCRAAIEAAVAQLGAGALVRVLDGQATAAMTAADAVLVASGTATLECLLAKRPMVVGYRIAPLTFALVRSLRLMQVDQYSLPNALAKSVLGRGEPLVTERMQADCTPERLAGALLPLLQHRGQALAELLPAYRALHEALRRDADRSAAEAVAELLLHRRA
jgi:lipid-A-disaccharide synthase